MPDADYAANLRVAFAVVDRLQERHDPADDCLEATATLIEDELERVTDE